MHSRAWAHMITGIFHTLVLDKINLEKLPSKKDKFIRGSEIKREL